MTAAIWLVICVIVDVVIGAFGVALLFSIGAKEAMKGKGFSNGH